MCVARKLAGRHFPSLLVDSSLWEAARNLQGLSLKNPNQRVVQSFFPASCGLVFMSYCVDMNYYVDVWIVAVTGCFCCAR